MQDRIIPFFKGFSSKKRSLLGSLIKYLARSRLPCNKRGRREDRKMATEGQNETMNGGPRENDVFIT